jgi:hypothetical protein
MGGWHLCPAKTWTDTATDKSLPWATKRTVSSHRHVSGLAKTNEFLLSKIWVAFNLQIESQYIRKTQTNSSTREHLPQCHGCHQLGTPLLLEAKCLHPQVRRVDYAISVMLGALKFFESTDFQIPDLLENLQNFIPPISLLLVIFLYNTYN